MTQGFDEYLDINYNENLDDLTKFLIHDAYKAGAASRQAEIDLLEKEIIETQKFLNNQNCVKQAEIDELKSKLKAINEYQGLIFNELQFNNPNYEIVFNKLEDIDDLSKGDSNE